MKKIAIIIVALIAMFIGVGGILPALAKVRDTGAIPRAFVGSYTVGVFLLTIVSASTVSWAIAKHKGGR
jgi:amino acid transporter